MKNRTCFMCKEPLNYNDYIATNISFKDFLIYSKIVENRKLCKIIFSEIFKKHELVKVWESDRVELICCHCHRFYFKNLSSSKGLWDLLKKESDPRLDVLKELGVQNYEDLKKLKNKK